MTELLFSELIYSGSFTREIPTCQPDSTSTKSTSGPYHLATLASAHMVSLVHNIGCSLQILCTKQKIDIHCMKSKHENNWQVVQSEHKS